MSNQTTMHVIFVNPDRRVIRNLYTTCILYRLEGKRPYIEFTDNIVKNILTPLTPKECSLDFYDDYNDRFNFNCYNILDLANDECEVPEEITVEILTIPNIGTDINGEENIIEEYILLEPGLWKTDKNGDRYRVCDDAMLHIINDIHVPELEIEYKEKGIEYSWKELFFEAHSQLHLMLIEEDDEEDIEDEDYDEEFDCDEDCENCVNTDCWDNPVHNLYSAEGHSVCDTNCEECDSHPDNYIEDDDNHEINNNKDNFKCMGDGDCEMCRLIECINNPKHNHSTTLNTVYLYSDRCAGHCDDCKRTYCITGERRTNKIDSVKDITPNITKCDKCSHRKECEKAKAEFNVRKLYPEQMIVHDIDKTSKYPVKMINVVYKPSSKRKHRKW